MYLNIRALWHVSQEDWNGRTLLFPFCFCLRSRVCSWLMAHGSWLLGVSKKLLKIAIRVFPRPFPFFLAFSRSLALQSAGILDVGRRCVGAWGSPFLWRSLQASCSLRFSSFFPLLFRRLSPFESLSFPLLSLASYGPRLQWTFLLHMQHVARNVACILLLIFEYSFI